MDYKKLLVEHEVVKPDQADFIEVVVKALTSEKRARDCYILEAWTGFGKTRAVLIATLLATYLTKLKGQRRRIIISCNTKDQQYHYFEELQKIYDKLKKIIPLQIRVLGSYSSLFSTPLENSENTEIKLMWLKGKSNYILKEKLIKALTQVEDTAQVEKILSLFDITYGDLEIAKLLDKEKIFKKVDIDFEALLATSYTSLNKLKSEEYILQLRQLLSESDIIIWNHYLTILYINKLYKQKKRKVSEEDILKDKINFAKLTDLFEEFELEKMNKEKREKLPISYEDCYVIFDEAHNLPYVYLRVNSRMRSLRKGIFLVKEISAFLKKEDELELRDLQERIEKLEGLVKDLKENKGEIVKKKPFSDLENLTLIKDLEKPYLSKIRDAVFLNLECIRKLQAFIRGKRLEKRLERFLEELQEDENFFEQAKTKINRLLLKAKDENYLHERFFLSFSEELGYPSLHFACRVKSLASKLDFNAMIFTSATLSACSEDLTYLLNQLNSPNLPKKELVSLFKELKFYPLETVGISGERVEAIKIFLPKNRLEKPIKVIYYTNTYDISGNLEEESFFEVLRKEYLDLVLPEVRKILSSELERGERIILTSKSYQEKSYYEEKLRDLRCLVNNEGAEGFTELLKKLKEAEKGILLVAGRYEGYDLPELGTLILSRMPFVDYETLYLVHGIQKKNVLSLFNFLEATINFKQLLGRLMRGNNEKTLYVLDSRVSKFKNLMELLVKQNICEVETREIEQKREEV